MEESIDALIRRKRDLVEQWGARRFTTVLENYGLGRGWSAGGAVPAVPHRVSVCSADQGRPRPG